MLFQLLAISLVIFPAQTQYPHRPLLRNFNFLNWFQFISAFFLSTAGATLLQFP